MMSLALVVLAGGCKKPVQGSQIVLSVTAQAPMTVARLHLDVTAGSRAKSFDVALGEIPPARSVAIDFPPDVHGDVSIHASAFDGGSQLLGSADVSGTLQASDTLMLSIDVSLGTGGGGDTPDLAVGSRADLSVAPDMTGVVLVCSSGSHACSDSCVDNASPDHCGLSCTPCVAPTGGTATCDGVKCGGTCPSGQKLCAGACIPADQACNGMCPSGDHACSGLCESNTSVNACGPTSCNPCQPPAANGMATCDGTMCGVACDNGYKACSGNCILSSGCCTNSDCPQPANGVGTCTVAHVCTSSCNSGYVKTGSGTCDVATPQPIAPLSTSHVTTQSPTLRWKLAANTNGAHVDICTTRACTTISRSVDVAGSSYKVTPALTAGVWFWRVHGRIGSQTGTITSPTWEFVVSHRTSSFDSSWGQMLDINGDGLDDLAVGYQNGGFLYSGGSNPPGSHQTLTQSGVAAIGDVNGDGFADLGAGTDIFFGGPNGISNLGAPEILTGPGSLYAAGDVNGDGYGDVFLSYPYTGTGSFTLHLGGPNGVSDTAAQTWTGASGVQNFGIEIFTADFNGDGYLDMVVGGPGKSWVFYGTASGLPATSATMLTNNNENAAFAGDMNGDGYPDVAGINWNNGSPAPLDFFPGGPSGLALAYTVPAPAGVTYVGSVTGGADLDGDGFGDLVGWGQQSFFVWRGTSGTIATPAQIALPANTSTNVLAIKLADDMNGDGLGDFISADEGWMTYTGIVYLYAGSASSTMVSAPTFTFSSPGGANTYYGFPIAR